jgi:hypothetical protein
MHKNDGQAADALVKDPLKLPAGGIEIRRGAHIESLARHAFYFSVLAEYEALVDLNNLAVVEEKWGSGGGAVTREEALCINKTVDGRRRSEIRTSS